MKPPRPLPFLAALTAAAVVVSSSGDARLTDFAVVSLTPDGSPDETFGSGGVVRTDFDGGSAHAALAFHEGPL